ncbi:MAG: glycoside hydrolase [Bacteroidales bacterium]|jgi:hypothetical protein|nr:glycoside hydrolase [Bacteroidales bacterium]
MNLFAQIAVTATLGSVALVGYAQTGDVFSPQQRNLWLQKAAAAMSVMQETVKYPVRKVAIVSDTAAYQGWKAVEAGAAAAFFDTSLKTQSGTVLDFGEHLTGYFSCTFALTTTSVSDAPVRLKLTFAETPAELAIPFDPYPGGLSRAWLQDETVTVDYIPSSFSLSRRVSFRYLKIEVLGSSSFDFRISEMNIRAQTSAVGEPEPLPAATPPLIKDIDRIGVATLRECMQTVYEDGPKRDRRLWLGDLYLEALANACSFKNHTLTKRCLYLLAAVAAPDGLLHACAFDIPDIHPQTGTQILDYALLFNTALLDYLKNTGDRETALDLWPVALQQTEVAKTFIGDTFMYNGKPIWIFFDWRSGFDTKAAIQGCFVKTFKDACELAQLLGRQKDVATLPAFTAKLAGAARKNMFDAKRGVFVSGPDRQISYLSQAWMTLGGVLSKKEAQKALKTVLSMPEAVYPGTPYGTHFFIEALIACGLHTEAREYLLQYWGGMVHKGADTFWEVYDPDNDLLSPYNFAPINSYCHAWACTPVYFIRNYPEIFAK